MKIEWFGKYRELIKALIRFSNNYSMVFNREFMGDEVKYSFAQIQVVEYLIENEDHVFNMAEIANALGTSASSFTKLTKKLVDKGFLKKFQIKGNRKEIIIQVTPFGRSIYSAYTENYATKIFQEMLELGEGLLDSQLELCTQMIYSLTSKPVWKEDEPISLIEIEE